ncbi:MAG: CoA transferase [Ilumatobacteraceae bacterium]
MLHGRRPSLVITRVTGFGQDGPTVASGFATIAESMSGLAAISGFDGGQPLLPAIALTDEVTGLVSAFATLAAVHSGVGQVVDTSLLESMFQVMGPLPSYFGVAGGIQERLGAGLPYSVPPARIGAPTTAGSGCRHRPIRWPCGCSRSSASAAILASRPSPPAWNTATSSRRS